MNVLEYARRYNTELIIKGRACTPIMHTARINTRDTDAGVTIEYRKLCAEYAQAKRNGRKSPLASIVARYELNASQQVIFHDALIKRGLIEYGR